MQVLRRFKADQSGSTAAIFGLALLPLLGAVGGALDYSRAAGMASQMQRAVDGAALAIVREPPGATPADIQAQGSRYVESGVKGDGSFRLGDVVATRVGATVTVTASGTVKSMVMQLFGRPMMPVAATAKATWGTGTAKGAGRIELALVLDNTGSMADTIGGRRKMDELQTAAKNLLRDLRTLADGEDKVRVAVVPFDTEVRLDAGTYRNKPWFRWTDGSDRAAWTGYVFDRYGRFATSDAAPSGGDSLYPAPRDTEYRTNAAMGRISRADLAPMRGLASMADYSAYSATVATVDAMRPRGYTDIALGVTWGTATLSASEPFTEAAPAGTSGVKKFMVVLTDGNNTANHVDGVLYNAECRDCMTAAARSVADETITARIDAGTAAACSSAKTAGIEVFTIKLLQGNDALLGACASDAGHYFNVQNAGELTKAFDSILNAISSTRLTV